MKNIKGWHVWVSLAAIFFVSLNLRPSVGSVGPLLNTITDELGISSAQVSLLTSIPVFCFGLFAPLAVPIQKKLGYKWSVNLLLVVIGLGTVARIWFDSYLALIVTSFVTGFAIAVISPIVNAFIKARFSHILAIGVGLYSLAIGAGAALASGFSGVLFEKFNSWQIALGVWGVLAIIAIVLWTIGADNKEEVVENTEENLQVRNPWKNKTAWLILLYFGLQTSLFFGLATWLPAVAQEQGFSLVTAGAVLTTLSVVSMVANVFIPMLINKYPNLVMWLYGLLTIGIVGAGALLIDANWAMWTGAVLFGISLAGLFPIGLMLPLAEAKNDSEAGSWSSMVLAGGFMMSAIIPLLIGVVYDNVGTHLVTKWIFVILYVLMFVSVYMYQVNKRNA